MGCALVLKPGAEFDETRFRDYLKVRLAPHKIPAHVVTYPAFPLLANGKVDALSLKKDLIERTKP